VKKVTALTGNALTLFSRRPLKKTLTPSSFKLTLMQCRTPLYCWPPAPDIWSRAFTTSMGVAQAQVTTPATPPAISMAKGLTSELIRQEIESVARYVPQSQSRRSSIETPEPLLLEYDCHTVYGSTVPLGRCLTLQTHLHQGYGEDPEGSTGTPTGFRLNPKRWGSTGQCISGLIQSYSSLPVVADILCEFLEVAIHLILYVREVYPSGIFQKRKKYNVPVQMSCHPELNQYIQDTLHCVKPLIEKNDAEKVVVVIMDKEHHPVERFVFEISQPPLLSISSDTLLSHVEQLLRAFILKISVCDAVLNNNPPGCSFAVLVHTRDAATRNMEKVQVIK
ncbi:hypothetical protein CCH79_00016855, partial [Gambusia affinis]